MLLEKLLEVFVRILVCFGDTQDLEGLNLGYEATLDTQSLLGDLLAAFIGEFFAMSLHSLSHDELKNFFLSLLVRQLADHWLDFFTAHRSCISFLFLSLVWSAILLVVHLVICNVLR